jgi:hypothetical protein
VIAQLILGLIDVYRALTGKPDGWLPKDDDWNELEQWAKRTPEQIKAEAQARRAGLPPRRSE